MTMPSVAELTIDPRMLTLIDNDARPLLFVHLDDWAVPPPAYLPPVPVIGIGNRRHPGAAWVDSVVEPPIGAATLIAAVVANPHAAAVAVHLLRGTEIFPLPAALTAESMAYGLLQGSAEHGAWLQQRQSAVARPPGRVVVERDGAVLRIVLDRPHARNAVDRSMRDELRAAFVIPGHDPAITRVEFHASGPAFSIGGDLAEFGITRDPATAHLIRASSLPAGAILSCASILHAHVQGACVGAGLEMAAFAARLTATPRAWFQLPELRMGLIPGAGGCVSVPRRIGRQRAALMILSGRRIGAATALEWGLVDVIEDLDPIDPGGADADGG